MVYLMIVLSCRSFVQRRIAKRLKLPPKAEKAEQYTTQIQWDTRDIKISSPVLQIPMMQSCIILNQFCDALPASEQG
uniref:Uncharacterized protein n=1 Tax=Arundo donax TaxID=35708 RepID=A0A0A9GMN1_ARUDO